MRRLTPLLFALLIAAPARADVDLDLSGFIAGYGLYVNQDGGGDLRNFDFRKESKVYLGGETELDSGLKVGALVEVYGERAEGAVIDASFLYLEDGRGKLILGESESAAEMLQVEAPFADKYIDSADPKINGFDLDAMGAGPNISDRLIYAQEPSNKATKIVYMTPSFDGLQLGVSYAPSVTEGNPASADPMQPDNEVSEFGAAAEGALRYEVPALGGEWTLGAGISHVGTEADNPTPTAIGSDDRLVWNTGAGAEYGDWTFGAALLHDNNGIEANGDTLIRVAGLNYKAGPTVYGLSYQLRTDEAAFATVNRAETSRVTGGATYKVADGLTLRGSVAYVETERGLQDGSGVQAAFGTLVEF